MTLDPVVQKIVLAAVGLCLVAIVLHMISRWRDAVATARWREELKAGMEALQLRQAEIRRLAERVVATSSTDRIAGYEVTRQIEAVFCEAQKSAEAAVELLKAHAARKGGNALLNVRTQQLPSGKWVAAADAVVVRPVPSGADRAV